MTVPPNAPANTPAIPAAPASGGAPPLAPPPPITTVDGVEVRDKSTLDTLVRDGLRVQQRERELAARETTLKQYEGIVDDVRGLANDPARRDLVLGLMRREIDPATFNKNKSPTGGAEPDVGDTDPRVGQLQRQVEDLRHRSEVNERTANRERLQTEVREAVSVFPALTADENARSIAEELVLAARLAGSSASARQLAGSVATRMSTLQKQQATAELNTRRENQNNAPIAPGEGTPGLSSEPPKPIAATQQTHRKGTLRADLKAAARAAGITGRDSVLAKPF